MDVVNRYLPNKNHQKGVAASVVIIVLLFFLRSGKSVEPATLLSDPFLQLPKQGSVNVVWFTNFEGSEHFVMYGDKKDQRANATTTKLSSMALSETPGAKAKATSVWRHEATASGLEARKRVPYFVESKDGKRNTEVKSKVFSLQPAPQAGQALKILLTSDHQNLPMVAANLQQVDSSIGKLDAVLFAGDTVLVPDRAAEWFGDASHGSAFFPSFQGRAKSVVGTTEYRGGEVLQHAPIFTALGNHDVMGRTNITNTSLDAHFEYSAPRSYAESLYKSTGLDPKSEAHAEWVANNSFNTRTYSEIFSLTGRAPGKLYYSVTLGDVHLIVLCAVRAYRPPTLDPNVASRFSERRQDFNRKELWRHGAFVMEPISKGSAQHVWLQYELKSKEFQSAKYRVVMLHHPIHSLGANIGPAFSNPYPYFKYGADGEVIAASYEYPFPDYLLNDVSPLLEQHGVQLVFYGHSHIWNRFAKPTTTATATMTTNFLESSNVGNTFGAFSTNTGRKRSVVDKLESAQGDPNGLSPVLPTHPNKTAGVGDKDHVSSNTVTVFSILDTDKGTVESYYFDTKHPNSKAQKFDEFSLVKPAAAAVTTPSEPVTTTSTTASARTTEQKPNPLANTKLRAAQVQSVMQPRPEESGTRPSPIAQATGATEAAGGVSRKKGAAGDAAVEASGPTDGRAKGSGGATGSASATSVKKEAAEGSEPSSLRDNGDDVEASVKAPPRAKKSDAVATGSDAKEPVGSGSGSSGRRSEISPRSSSGSSPGVSPGRYAPRARTNRTRASGLHSNATRPWRKSPMPIAKSADGDESPEAKAPAAAE